MAMGSCPDSGAPWSSAIPPSVGRGWEATTIAFAELVFQIDYYKLCFSDSKHLKWRQLSCSDVEEIFFFDRSCDVRLIEVTK